MVKTIKSIVIVFAAIVVCYSAGYGCGRLLKHMLTEKIEYPATERQDVVDDYFDKMKCDIIK